MNLGKTILKSTLVFVSAFWLAIIHSEGFHFEMIPFIFLSFGVLLILCGLLISVTIMPFFWFAKKNLSNKMVFRKYFPLYSVITFLGFFYTLLIAAFETTISIFVTVLFFTLLQSWIWLCKSKKLKIDNKQNTEKEIVTW